MLRTYSLAANDVEGKEVRTDCYIISEKLLDFSNRLVLIYITKVYKHSKTFIFHNTSFTTM